MKALRIWVTLFLLCAAASAQLTLSTIRGTANDPTGAIVARAEIEIVNLGTNAKRAVQTNENGDFEVPDLQRGTYRLTARAEGFKTVVVDDIVLEGNQIRRINVPFEIGAVGTQVTVAAGAAVINTESSKIQGVITGARHYDNPWVAGKAGFDPSLYLTTLPLVSQTTGVWSSQWAGQSTGQVQMGQDGHTNDGSVNQINDILDSEEITVVTVNNTAEFSRVGYMNMVTKSGSNELHGRLSYWNLNSALAAREFFEARKSKVLIHTISASVSGPIRKDKTFFYASANILRIPSSQFYLLTVPTAQMRQGDFSQLLTQSRPVTLMDPLAGTPFPGNVIPRSRHSSVSTRVNDKYLPAPNRGGPNDLANNFGFTFPFPADYAVRRDFTQRVDHQFSTANRLMVRGIENVGLYVLPSNYPAFEWTRRRVNYHIVAEDTHVFSPTLVNTLRVGLYRETISDGDTVYGVTPFKGDEAVKELGILGVNRQNLSAQGFPRIDISGYATLRTQPGGRVQADNNWGFADTVTWSKGRHVIKFGGEYKPQSRFTGNVPEGNYGTFNFNGSLSGYSYSDFLLGLPFTSSRLDPRTNRTRTDSELGLFITDAFKVNSRLTLDIGLRWDRFGSPSFEDGLMYRWDMASGAIVIPSEKAAEVSPLYPKNIQIATGEVRQRPQNTNFAPRLGAAYRIRDNFVVRGGYGIFTETLGRYNRLLTGGPFEITETYQQQIQNGRPLLSFPNPFPDSLGAANTPSQSFTGYPLEQKNGRIHQFNLSIERQVRDTGLRLSYVGSRNRGINYSIGINKPRPGLTAFTQSMRPWPQFVGGSYFRTDGEQNFNALTAQVQRKMGAVTFDAHWTWASNYSNLNNLENPYAPLVFSRDAFTQRHRGVINAVWQLPVGHGRRFMSAAPAAVDHILGGWQIYWIAYLESGQFFSPTFSGRDTSNTNTVGGLPDRICNGNLPKDQRTFSRWFDTSCFAVPAAGTFGNSGANILEGPGKHLHHISLAKTIALTERFRFTFTAAAANAFNHPNFRPPASNISVPGSAGVLNTLFDGAKSRQIELRGRIDF